MADRELFKVLQDVVLAQPSKRKAHHLFVRFVGGAGMTFNPTVLGVR